MSKVKGKITLGTSSKIHVNGEMDNVEGFAIVNASKPKSKYFVIEL